MQGSKLPDIWNSFIKETTKNKMAQKSHGGESDVSDNKTTDTSLRQKYQKSSTEDYGFYFFPQRNTDDPAQVQKSYWEKFWNKKNRLTLKCETNVVWCANNSRNHFLVSHSQCFRIIKISSYIVSILTHSFSVFFF